MVVSSLRIKTAWPLAAIAFISVSLLENFGQSLKMGRLSEDKIHVDGSDQDSSDPQQTMTVEEGTTEQTNTLRREFKERHVSMIAVAGAIGTGLIIGTGTGLVRGGPASLLIAYCAVGLVVFFIMTAMGEMATMFPMDKGFGGYATRFVDPALG